MLFQKKYTNEKMSSIYKKATHIHRHTHTHTHSHLHTNLLFTILAKEKLNGFTCVYMKKNKWLSSYNTYKYKTKHINRGESQSTNKQTKRNNTNYKRKIKS